MFHLLRETVLHCPQSCLWMLVQGKCRTYQYSRLVRRPPVFHMSRGSSADEYRAAAQLRGEGNVPRLFLPT